MRRWGWGSGVGRWRCGGDGAGASGGCGDGGWRRGDPRAGGGLDNSGVGGLGRRLDDDAVGRGQAGQAVGVALGGQLGVAQGVGEQAVAAREAAADVAVGVGVAGFGDGGDGLFLQAEAGGEAVIQAAPGFAVGVGGGEVLGDKGFLLGQGQRNGGWGKRRCGARRCRRRGDVCRGGVDAAHEMEPILDDLVQQPAEAPFEGGRVDGDAFGAQAGAQGGEVEQRLASQRLGAADEVEGAFDGVGGDAGDVHLRPRCQPKPDIAETTIGDEAKSERGSSTECWIDPRPPRATRRSLDAVLTSSRPSFRSYGYTNSGSSSPIPHADIVHCATFPAMSLVASGVSPSTKTPTGVGRFRCVSNVLPHVQSAADRYGIWRAPGPRAAASHSTSLGNLNGRPDWALSHAQYARASCQQIPTTGWPGCENRASCHHLGSVARPSG